uniref:N_BRCA1_IG domain-containing protein n=1 Tax=Caenorhabditis japonica TaxID=281687 RepID=A0A8R1DQ17_CAEJA
MRTRDSAHVFNFVYRPNASFFCGWRVVNDGRFRWPDGTRLAFVDGDPIDYEVWKDTVIDPDQSDLVEIRITCPIEMGDFKARFQFVTPQNIFFGESIWVIICVRPLTEEEAAMEVVVQPMDPFPRELAVMPYNEGSNHRFRSPVPDPPQDDSMME